MILVYIVSWVSSIGSCVISILTLSFLCCFLSNSLQTAKYVVVVVIAWVLVFVCLGLSSSEILLSTDVWTWITYQVSGSTFLLRYLWLLLNIRLLCCSVVLLMVHFNLLHCEFAFPVIWLFMGGRKHVLDKIRILRPAVILFLGYFSFIVVNVTHVLSFCWLLLEWRPGQDTVFTQVVRI
jgi:hypothetical protein